MRLVSARVRAYRIHKDVHVRFDDARTLIGGPNESGKSTLVEAIHHALFLRARTTGDGRERMQSSLHPGSPEVEVEFSCGQRRFTVRKRFSGANGSCTLTEHGGHSWNGDAAEAELAELLGVSPTSGGRGAASRAAGQWAHLWVTQGTAGDDPMASTAQEHDALMQRLQSLGGAAVMQSDLDARVADAVSERHDACFTRSGYRRGSDAQRALDAHASASVSRQACERDLAALEHAALDLESAEQSLRESPLPSLQAEYRELEANLTRLRELRQAQGPQRDALARAEESVRALTDADEAIRSAREQLTGERSRLSPLELELQSLIEHETELRQHVREKDTHLRDCQERVRLARRRDEIISAHADRLRLAGTEQQLEIRRNLVETNRARRASIAQELARLPGVTREGLSALRELERTRDRTAAALAAMAAGFEILATDRDVSSALERYTPGTRYVLADDTEISIGDTVRLRITPGGGTSLAHARRDAREAQLALEDALATVAVADLHEAATAAERRQQLETEDAACAAALEGAAADSLEEELRALVERREELDGEITRRQALGPNISLPATIVESDRERLTTRAGLRDAEEQEHPAQAELEAVQAAVDQASESITQRRDALVQLQHAVQELETTCQVLERQHGNDEARREQLRVRRAAVISESEALSATEESIAQLQPELLEREEERLGRAIRQAEASREDAIRQKAHAEALLRRDGSTDPREALALARAREEDAAARKTVAVRRAAAAQLLHELFGEQQRALAQQFTEPLANRVGDYLVTMFGPGVTVEVKADGERLAGLRVTRPGLGVEAFEFSSLSGGAKEQVATAFRLAMAQVLASGHDGTLPVVLDDSFAYSDAERVRGVQRMLDLAASRGLQVTVLSCNPNEYAGFGASTISLPSIRSVVGELGPRWSTRPDTSVDDTELQLDGEPPEEETESASLPSPPTGTGAIDERSEELLDALRAAGGTRGNHALRQMLGWDPSLYESVKSRLLNEGRVRSGRGRGGSLILTE